MKEGCITGHEPRHPEEQGQKDQKVRKVRMGAEKRQKQGPKP
jgi:hypothetical protein